MNRAPSAVPFLVDISTIYAECTSSTPASFDKLVRGFKPSKRRYNDEYEGPQEVTRDAGFALSEGRDSGFQSNMGASFGIESIHGMQDAENIHQDYGIGRKFESGLQY